ncbi:MAG: RraA family protein [Bryobacterales bacterium]|nr:RraA family protein [Bryobacterales bacterium]
MRGFPVWNSRCPVVTALILLGLGAHAAFAQLGTFDKEKRIAVTHKWTGARADDGRPLVPDDILARLKTATAEEAWGVLRGEGYHYQFEGNWQLVNPSAERMVGRVVTAQFMPVRPDMNEMINRVGAEEGRVSRGQNSWVIDTLKPGDVLVVDMFGKIRDGTFAGDNLATAIYTKSKNGLIVNGSVRDVSGMQEIDGFRAFVKGVDPSAIKDVMMVGINVPIRIGETTILPGDVVVSDPEGLTFIPPHLAEKVATTSENVQLRDKWGHQMLREGKYTPGQIDTKWSDAMTREFEAFAAQERAKRQR